jgi:threonine/homoserine/homoserine lactone efflux protein
VDYLALSLIMLLAQFSPGPDMLLLLRNALGHPARTGLWTVLGIACGLSVHMLVVLTGLGVAIQSSRVLYPLLLIAGACWLGKLSISLLKEARAMPAAASAVGPENAAPSRETAPALILTDRAAFLQGLVTNLSNVKAMVFLGTIVLTRLGEAPGPGRKAAFFGIVIGQAVLFWSLFVLALQRPQVRRWWDRVQRPLTMLFGAGLLLMALGAVWRGILLIPG